MNKKVLEISDFQNFYFSFHYHGKNPTKIIIRKFGLYYKLF